MTDKDDRHITSEIMEGCVSWSELPPELINKIYKHITTILEYITFRSVCESWRCSVDPHPLPLQQSPWLSFQPSPASHHFNFFTRPNSKKIHTLPLPFTTIIGSSYGYLVLRSQNILSLFNPISLSQINLPLPEYTSFEKVVLSPPLEEGISTVVVLFSGSSHLGICQAGLNTQWTYMDEHIYVHDAIFFEDRFYVVDSMRRVFILADDNTSLRSYSGFPVGSITTTASDGDRIRCYLVECDGYLFLVIRCICNNRHVDNGVRTKGFAVYKRDMKDEDGKWRLVKNLMKYVVFLGSSQSVMMNVERCTSGFQGNCIYFLDDRGYGCLIAGDIGVFDMSNGKVEALPYDILDHIADLIEKAIVYFMYEHPKQHLYLSGNYAPVKDETPPYADLIIDGILPECLNGEFARVGANAKFAPVAGYHLR